MINNNVLVSIVLLAYNQEEYVENAIKGALNQSYRPIEIILSDDNSNDNTYEIMQHYANSTNLKDINIKINKTISNNGLWSHLGEALNKAKGEYIVIMAGDDISLPDRVTTGINHLIKTESSAIDSSYDTIDEAGSSIETNIIQEHKYNLIWKFINEEDKNRFVGGATAIYKSKCIKNAFRLLNGIQDEYLNNEDMLLSSYIIASGGKIDHYNNTALIKHRINQKSISNHRLRDGKYIDFLDLYKREINSRRSINTYIKALKILANEYPDFKTKINHYELSIIYNENLIALYSSSPNLLYKIKSILLIANIHDIRLVATRIFGIRFLSIIKSLLYKRRNHI